LFGPEGEHEFIRGAAAAQGNNLLNVQTFIIFEIIFVQIWALEVLGSLYIGVKSI